MASVFRYSAVKYNDALLALGNVRIGTLHDFRKTEHKEGIFDAAEGTKFVEHHIPIVNTSDAGSIHVEALRQFNGVKIGRGAHVENFTLCQTFDVPDFFIHCTSFEFSRRVMRQFEGAESCVEIFDVNGFYQRLTETLNFNFPVRLLTIEKIQYKERSEVWNGRNWGAHPAIIKEPKFSMQVEVRAIWVPRISDPISPVIINDIGLTNFCRLINI